MTPIEVALNYVAAFASGDADRVADCVTEDFRNNQMGALGNRFQGQALYRERLKGFLGRFAGLRYDVDAPFADGDRVALPYRMTATDEGRPIAIEGVMIVTVRGGHVAARDDYWDGLSYLQQMGMAPPPFDKQ